MTEPSASRAREAPDVLHGRRGRGAIAVVLGLGVLVNYFDRVNLSVAHDALRHTFGLSDVAFGYLLSSYSWTYAAMQLPSGTLLDRFGVRRVMIVATLLWAAASALAAAATAVAVLFAARLLLGIGEAPTFPANAKAVGLWFREEERSVPTATFDAAAKLSIAIGTPALGLVLLHYGLRANFATTAVLSLLYAGLFTLVYRDPNATSAFVKTSVGTETRHKTTSAVRIRDLLVSKKVVGLALGAGAYNFCFYLLLTWLPVYLELGLHMTAARAVVWAAIPWTVAAAADFGIGGLLVDGLIRSGHSADVVRRSVLLAGTGLGMLVIAPAILDRPRWIVFCLALALSGMSAAAPVLWTIPSLLAPSGSTGRVGSIMNLANQLAAIAAPIITGYIVHYRHSFAGAFLLAGAILLMGIGSYVFLLGRIEQIGVPGEVSASAARA